MRGATCVSRPSCRATPVAVPVLGKGSRPAPCATCNGSGEVRRAARSMFGQSCRWRRSDLSRRLGFVITTPCDVCRGEGRIKGERTVAVDVPPGVSAQHYLTLRGQGTPGPARRYPGDLIVMIEIKADDRFHRDGDDLMVELPVSFSQAALGTTAVVPTPYGDESLAVPPGTQSGSVLRIRGKGLPRLAGNGVGDLNVTVFVWTPDELNETQRQLFAELARHEGEGPKRKGGFWSSSRKRSACEQRVVAPHAHLPPGQSDAVAAALVTATGQGVEEPAVGTVCTAVEGETQARDLLQRLRAAFAGVRGEITAVEAVDWSIRWRDGIVTRTFGRLVLTPSWLPVVAAPVRPW